MNYKKKELNINLVLGSDQRYFDGLYATLTSLFLHTNTTKHLEIYIFDGGINTISKHLVFHESIAQISLKTLQSSNIDINELCVFHMRVLDLCQSKTFEYAYNNYDEQKVYNSICQYLYEIGKYNLIQNIFNFT